MNFVFRLILDRPYEACTSVAGWLCLYQIYCIPVVHFNLVFGARFPNSQHYKSISLTHTHTSMNNNEYNCKKFFGMEFFPIAKPTHRIIFFSFQISFSHLTKNPKIPLDMSKTLDYI